MFFESLFPFSLFPGLDFLFLLLLLDDLELVLDSLHALPLKLIVDEEEIFFEEGEDVVIVDGVEILLLGPVVEDLGYFFGEGSEILLIFKNLVADFGFLIGACFSCG